VENVPPNGMFPGVPPRIFRFESFADVRERIGDVRFSPESGPTGSASNDFPSRFVFAL
jgi:hypothetical protein